MNNELRHEVTMVVNGESRRVMVEPEPEPKPEAAQEPEKAKAPAAAKTAVPAKKTVAKKPSLLERAKAAVTGKGKKA